MRKNWRYRPMPYSNIAIAPKKTVTILDLQGKGWILYGATLHNNPSLVFTVELECGTESYKGSTDTTTLYSVGLTAPVASGWWCSLYNTVASLYSLQFAPAVWWPFSQRFKLTVENPTSTEALITRALILAIELKD